MLHTLMYHFAWAEQRESKDTNLMYRIPESRNTSSCTMGENIPLIFTYDNLQAIPFFIYTQQIRYRLWVSFSSY